MKEFLVGNDKGEIIKIDSLDKQEIVEKYINLAENKKVYTLSVDDFINLKMDLISIDLIYDE
ncbi:hypothetical protein BC940DRAFT_120132 [Gongronella butleri]|nr:hypothetical protein BC940DRAFT_120132 [Gongronella butleri]